MKNTERNILFYVLMFLAMLSWGGSWTSAKVVANQTAPEVLVFWRFLATFVSFAPVFLFIKTPLKINKKSLLYVLLGSFFLVAYNKLFFTGLRTGLAGAGGVLVTTLNPVATFAVSALLFKHKIRWKELAGLILGFAGGMVLLQVWSINLDKALMSGNLYFLVASVVWALLTITTQKASGMPSLVYSFYIYGVSALMDLTITLPFYDITEVFSFGLPFWLNIIYLSVVVTTFGTTAYFYASSKLGASRASSFVFLVPTSAVLISWLVLGEIPGLPTIVGGIMAMSAVYMINSKAKEKGSDTPEATLPTEG